MSCTPCTTMPRAPGVDAAVVLAGIYAEAPPALRVQMLDTLLRPLSALSLVTVAEGIFARIWFRGGWGTLRLCPEAIEAVRARHVRALAEHVAQLDADTVAALVERLHEGARATPAADRAALPRWRPAVGAVMPQR